MPESCQIIQRPHLGFPEGHEMAGLDPVIQSILLNRGVTHSRDCDSDLSLLLPFSELKGIHEACELLSAALTAQKQVVIVGDFDADGATSTALAMRALKAFGFERLAFLVPDRFKLGYGLSAALADMAAAQGAQLIITVDNGVSSIEGVARANQLGIEVLVTDHHLPGEQLPKAQAMVNPNQAGCTFPSKALAGVGVMFYVLIAFRAFLRERNYFQNTAPPNLAQWLDLVALGTVADLVPLDANNRRLVQQGLARIRAGQASVGLKALIAVSRKNESRFKSADFGFALGPRLNAAGRLDSMSLGIECLLCDDMNEALALAHALNDFNEDRKHIESAMKEEALALLPAPDELRSQHTLLCLFDECWHQGVVGIVASRLKENFHLPCVVFAQDDEHRDLLKGSARSIAGLHIRDALVMVDSRYPGLIQKFGGHAMAAGMTIRKADFETFKQALSDSIEQLLGHEKEQLLQAKLFIDSPLQARHFSLEFVNSLAAFEPWGQHFPEPQFSALFLIEQQRILQDKHLKWVLVHEGIDTKLDAIAFNVPKHLWNLCGQQVQLVYRLDINEFRETQNLQLVVEKILFQV